MYLKDNIKALKYCKKAIYINPNNDLNYSLRGLIKMSLGDWEGVVSDFAMAIEIDSTISGYYRDRGDAKEELGDKKGATEDFDIAEEMDRQAEVQSRKQKLKETTTGGEVTIYHQQN